MPVPSSFNEIADQPDELLAEGLKTVDSRLLQTSLVCEPDAFVNKLLRAMKPVMRGMFTDDLDVLKESKKISEPECREAQGKVVGLFKTFLEKKGVV